MVTHTGHTQPMSLDPWLFAITQAYQHMIKQMLMLSLVLSLSISCSKTPVPLEQAIEKQLNHAVSAIEQLDSDALLKVLADDFDIQGNISRSSKTEAFNPEKIKQHMMLLRLRKQKLSVTLTHVQIKADDYNSQLATMEANVMITGGSGLLPDDGRLLKIRGSWRLFDDEWRLTQLNWQ